MITYDDKTALVVVDVQNDFADPKGSLYVPGGEEVVPAVNDEVGRALAVGAMVVYTQDWHPESTPHFQKDGGVWPVHCVMETWGAELHSDLEVDGPVVRKGSNGEDGYSGFTMRDPETGKEMPTPLRAMLEDKGIERVVVVGLALDVCVKATALDAVTGFETTVVVGASAPVELQPGDGARAIEELEQNRVVIVG
ncbi:MAG: isochorismatase family protein [Acidimicrobiia bacterium]